MKNLIGGCLSFILTSCYFGMNEAGEEIVNNCYLVRWDSDTWISYSKSGDGIWDTENMIVGHNVFTLGDYDDFIFGMQHPCENKLPHVQDYDSLRPDRNVTNYFIIDSREDSCIVHIYHNEITFNDARTLFGIPSNLPYKFYASEID